MKTNTMKKLVTTVLTSLFLFCVSAQTTQLLTNTAHEFGFVDATKTNFYTYNDISNTNPNAAGNFELKKFNPITNTFSVIFTMPNNNQFTKFYPIVILNGKGLFIGKHLNSIYGTKNYFIYDGTTLDSVFSTPIYHLGNESKTHIDILNQKVYFATESIPFYPEISIYQTDFTKIGTKKKKSFNNFIFPNQGLYGFDSTLYFISYSSGKIMKLSDTILSIVDTLNTLHPYFNYMYEDEINKELYFYRGEGYSNNNANNRVFKINALGQKTFLLGAPSTGNGTLGYSMLGKVANKLTFISKSMSGLVTYDITSGFIDTLYSTNSVLQPSINSPAEIAIPFFTKTNNHLYFYTIGNNMWVTDGINLKELNSAPLYQRDSIYIPYTIERNYFISFCNENWICIHKNGTNSTRMIMYDPNAVGASNCLQSSDPNINCLFSSAYQVNNTTYILSKSNLYEITNCSIPTALSDLEKSEENIDLFYSHQSIKFKRFPEQFSGSRLLLKNIDGKTIFKLSIEKNKYEYAILNEIAKGFYFVEMVYEGQSIKRKKIIIE
jgi:hypothetical protein